MPNLTFQAPAILSFFYQFLNCALISLASESLYFLCCQWRMVFSLPLERLHILFLWVSAFLSLPPGSLPYQTEIGTYFVYFHHSLSILNNRVISNSITVFHLFVCYHLLQQTVKSTRSGHVMFVSCCMLSTYRVNLHSRHLINSYQMNKYVTELWDSK